MDRAHMPVDSLLEQAACIVRRSKETAGMLELAESYKGGQTEELIKFKNQLDDFNNSNNPNSFISKSFKQDTPRDYKRIWDALTGRYFMLPTILGLRQTFKY